MPADILVHIFNPYNSVMSNELGIKCPLEYLQVYKTIGELFPYFL